MSTESKAEIRNHQSEILYIFTRTSLHVEAGAIDQPIQRERHTRFPIIPASSLKGTFADAWNDTLRDENDAQGKREKGPCDRRRRSFPRSLAFRLGQRQASFRRCGAVLRSEVAGLSGSLG